MVIGLLGGIGSGKSAVAALFAEQGAEVVDADRLAHEALRTGSLRAQVAARFGQDVLGSDGEVDRRALSARVFDDEGALRDLNALVHPSVLDRIRRRIAEHRARAASDPEALLVLDVPLLAESPLRADCDAFVFIDAAGGIRRARVADRGWAPGEIERREARQMPLDEKRALAGSIVDNSGSIEETRDQVARLARALRLSRGGEARGGRRELIPRGQEGAGDRDTPEKAKGN